jgi:hypothetical protein
MTGEWISGQDSELRIFAAVAVADLMRFFFFKCPLGGGGGKVENLWNLGVFLEYMSIMYLLWIKLCSPQIHMKP